MSRKQLERAGDRRPTTIVFIVASVIVVVALVAATLLLAPRGHGTTQLSGTAKSYSTYRG